MNKGIGLMGCGWLGLPLAKALIAKGYTVKGSTTSQEKLYHLRREGIQPFHISVLENRIEGPIANFLRDVETVIINIPPRLRSGNAGNYVSKMKGVLDAIQKSEVKHIVFASSTSVYGDLDGDVDENTVPKPTTESGKQLLASEGLFKNEESPKATIVRFGGLIGPTRHPITLLSGKKGLSNGNAPINLIHIEDCLQIMINILENNWWNDTFNAVYPYHPSKREYYTLQAQKRGLQPPKYIESPDEKGKKVHSNRLIFVKEYDFSTTIL